MKLAYVTGKYSDPRGTFFVHANIEEARRVSAILWALGISVICPHANTYHIDGVASYEDFIEGDLLQVERCDCLVALPSHLESSGSKREVEHARKHNIPVFLWPQNTLGLVKFCRPEGISFGQSQMAEIIMRGDEDARAVASCIK